MINGIDYLKKMYPGRDDKDYQPSGLDLRINKVFEMDIDAPDQLIGIVGGKKMLPKLKEVKPIILKDEGQEYEVFELIPDEPYIVEVQGEIKIGDHNAQLYKPRSTLLRSFVTVSTAVGDLGYNGHLQFLVINHGYNSFYIEKGERFAQLVDFEVQGGSESYEGDYQDDKYKPGVLSSTLG